MRLTAALEFEKLRDETSRNKIVLNKDGKFYHVYDWSAWLVKTVVCTEEFQHERGDAKILAASRYNSKTGDYVMAGFPLESVSKYIPSHETIEEMEGGDLTIGINLPDELEKMTMEEMGNVFEAWKVAQPIKESKTKGNQQVRTGDMQSPTLARSGLFSIISEVISYPLETKTPTENIEFISMLKQKAVALL